MKAKILLIALIIIIVNKFAQAQTTDCLKDFDFLVKKIQSDYPGYNDKVTNANRAQLTALEREIRGKITNHPDSCGYYLKEYTDFFKDYHLRVNRIWQRNNQQPEIMDVSTYGKNFSINVDSLREVTAKTTAAYFHNFQSVTCQKRSIYQFRSLVVGNQAYVKSLFHQSLCCFPK